MKLRKISSKDLYKRIAEQTEQNNASKNEQMVKCLCLGGMDQDTAKAKANAMYPIDK